MSGPRRIEVEFGLKIRDVSPAELTPLLESLAALAKNGVVKMSPETQRLLSASLPTRPPAALAVAAGCRPGLTTPAVIAALTRHEGRVQAAAQELDYSQTKLYAFCKEHGIVPKAFRAHAARADRHGS